jgi:Fic family protein
VIRKARFWVRHADAALNERQRKALNCMLDAGPPGFEGGMNNRKYASLTRSSPATAQRDLADLVARGLLTPVGSGRSARYELVAEPPAAR